MPTPAYEKFRKSTVMDFDAWHDGTGYDLSAFAQMTDDEKQTLIKEFRGMYNITWREMEVLALDHSGESFDRLRDELASHHSVTQRAQAIGQLYGTGRTNDSVFDHELSHILDDVKESDSVVAPLLRVAERCGPRTREALLRGVRDRPKVAIHFAAALLDVDGLSDDLAAFDPKFRPTLLKLLPDEPADVRATAFAKVCEWLKVDPATIPQ